MTITKLEIRDFKRIEAAAIDPDSGKPVMLTGDNAQGKTSVLDGIEWALRRSGTGKPVHDGSEQAAVGIRLDSGYQILRREKDGGGHYLEVLDSEGNKVKKPQAFLDSLMGDLAFDPEAFTRLKPKQQADALREAVGLDLSDLDEQYREAYARRTEANRSKQTAEKKYKDCPVAAGEPMEPVNTRELSDRHDALNTELQEFREARAEADRTNDEIAEIDEAIQELENRLAKLRESRKGAVARHDKARDKVDEMAPKVEGHHEKLDEIRNKLADADEANKAVYEHNRKLEESARLREEYREALDHWRKQDRRVKEIEDERQRRIREIEFPVDGLEIDEDRVLVGGVPFDDLNTAERIRVSTLIAMAQNPELKVIFVREGALLSRRNLALLADLAEKHDFQVWMEVFSEDARDTGLHIVDGQVRLVNGKPAETQNLELV